MASRRKFTAFGGVFTPSILTILGVIMYLRLPQVVGEAGMWMAILIVVMAHTVSATTGLSVSSIATDKRVKAGGSYYIISRSLGLPIGGTLGLALFIGLSFGVSLYLVGFAESFLQYWGIAIDPATGVPDKDMIRLTGSIALLTVTVVTFISTSLAIKTQYIIMALIVLSLGSIFIGSAEHGPPTLAHLEPMAEGSSLVVLFAIFFPAVTGFEAGVSMSGDLKDPKRDIPKGTLAAIGAGFFVYVGLCVFLAYRIPADQLAHNPRVLLDYAFFAPIVVAGIWGATISSALGSILGAPRILQACAQDRIGPRLFAKGSGPDNEPRNALLLTFVIAEAGILIGSLDAIAGIVSMFFMASYGVLNLSCAVEAWASPDFRPDFKIPKFVPILGAIVCFVLMMQLDMIAMFGAFAAMGAVYLYLKRKELALEGGDTWTGIWSSIVRKALDRLSRATTHQRNWRPNVLLFTSRKTPHAATASLTQAMIQHNGVLSEFELFDADGAGARSSPDVDLTPPAQRVVDADLPEGFSRKMVQTGAPFETIQAVTRFHGIAGFEPNTTMIDWEVVRRDADGLTRLLRQIEALQRHAVISVQRPSSFEAVKRIDVWWHGSGRNLSLGLAIVRFLTTAQEWVQATPRFFAAVADAGQKRSLEQRLAAWLHDARLSADVTVLDHPASPDTFEDLVARTSDDADLIIVGIDDSQLDEGLDAVVARLSEARRPMLLLRAASDFEDPFPHIDLDAVLAVDGSADASAWRQRPETLDLLRDPTLAEHVITYHGGLTEAVLGWHRDGAVAMSNAFDAVLADIVALAERTFEQLVRASELTQLPRRRRALYRAQRGFLGGVRERLGVFERRFEGEQVDALRAAVAALSDQLAEVEARMVEELPLAAEAGQEGSGAAPSRRRGGLLGLLRRDQGFVVVPVRRHGQALHGRLVAQGVDASIQRLRDAREAYISNLDAVIVWLAGEVATVCRELMPLTGQSEPRDEALQERVAGWRTVVKSRVGEEHRAALTMARDAAQELGEVLVAPAAARKPRVLARSGDGAPLDVDGIVDAHEAAWALQRHHIRRAQLDVALRSLHHELRAIGAQITVELTQRVERVILAELDRFVGELEALREAIAADPGATVDLRVALTISLDDKAVLGRMTEAIEAQTESLPEQFDTLSEASFVALSDGRFDDLEEVTIAVRRLVAFILKNELVGAFREALTQLAGTVVRAGNSAREVARLVSFGGASVGTSAEREEVAAERLDLTRGGIERVQTERRAVASAWAGVRALLDGHVEAAVDRTRANAIGRSAGQLDRFIRTHEREGVFSVFPRMGRSARDGVKRFMVDMSYRWSRGVLLARRLKAEQDEPASAVERIVTLHRASTPSPEVWDALPIFYRQVFLGRAADDPAYWLSAKDERDAAEAALSSHRRGRPGAILVTGPPGAGVGAFTRRFCARHFTPERTFVVRPTEGGSVDPMRLDAAIRAAVNFSGDVDEAIATLPEGAVVVLDSLEMWWERSPGGLAAVEHLEGLIERHGGRTLFVLALNEYVMRLLGRLGALMDVVLATVHCHPLEALRLREAVMRRHDATGLGLRLAGHKDKEPSEWRTARLFSGLFGYSGGYVGMALAAWIAHIEEVTSEHVTLRRPKAPDLGAFDALDPDWVSLLIELVMHRRITRERLVRVTGQSEAALTAHINGLTRAGLVDGDGITRPLSVDRFMLQHVTRWLRSREVL